MRTLLSALDRDPTFLSPHLFRAVPRGVPLGARECPAPKGCQHGLWGLAGTLQMHFRAGVDYELHICHRFSVVDAADSYNFASPVQENGSRKSIPVAITKDEWDKHISHQVFRLMHFYILLHSMILFLLVLFFHMLKWD